MILLRRLANGNRVRGVARGDYTPVTVVEITTANIAKGTIDVAFSQTLTAAHGAGTKVWTKQSGNFPTGISMNSSGVISGTPTLIETQTNIVIRVTDSTGFDEATYSMEIREEANLHDYFDTLVALDKSTWDHGTGSFNHRWSLREQSQLNGLCRGIYNTNSAPFWVFDVLNEQDAAKFTLDPADLPPGHPDGDPPRDATLRFPCGIVQSSGDTVLIIFDMYFDDAFLENINPGDAGVTTWKIYNCYCGDSVNDISTYVGPKIHWNRADEPGYGSGAQSVGTFGFSLIPNNQLEQIPGLIASDGVIPTGVGAYLTGTRSPAEDRYHVQRNIWGRFIIEIHTNVPGTDIRFNSWKSQSEYTSDTPESKASFDLGTWIMVNIWHIDELRDASRLIFGIPWLSRKTMLSVFGFEFDTSANVSKLKGAGFPCILFARNMIMLRNYVSPGATLGVLESDTTIFERPVGP